MASTIWLCARSSPIATSLPKVARVRIESRCSRTNISAHRILSRWQSTATAFAKTDQQNLGAVRADENAQIPFSSLKGIIAYDTLKAITIKPFKMTHMTAVQAAVLPLLPSLVGPYSPDPPADGSPRSVRDLLVKARTGTGKTLAFLVPAIEARLKSITAAGKQAVVDAGLTSDKALEARAKRVFTRTHVGTLIISPTRELATQIANEALRLAHHHDDFEVRLFVGGMSKRMQMRDWMKGRRDIVVSTPGRLLDLLNSEPEVKNGIAKTQILVLDEADTLLDMGFRDDVEAIKEFLPPTPQRQTFLFSATVSRQIQQIARSTLDRNHTFINTVSENESPVHARIPQYHTVLPSAADQIPHLVRLIAHDQLSNPGKSKIILFLPTTKMTQLFATLMRELAQTSLPSLRNTRVYEIHSKRTQESRTSTSDAFRQDKTGASVLVTSDVSARGVDYPGVTRVIQLGIPGGTEQYIHRIGRTGRAGTGGRGDLVLLPWEAGFLTWQLDGVPLKPVTVNELQSQVKTLAQAYDADPAAAFKDVSHVVPLGSFSRSDAGKPKMYISPVADLVEKIPAAVDGLLPSLDEEAIKETFASLLGYYLAKSPELRTQKGVIVQGCKDWSTQACGLPVPPYVSEAFLQRLGFSDGRTKRFGQSFPSERSPMRQSGSPWGGRGMQKFKGRAREAPEWAQRNPELDPDDPAGSPEEYRSGRYNSRSWARDGAPHSQSQRQPHENPPFEESRRQSEFGPRGQGFASGRGDDHGRRYGDRTGGGGGYGGRPRPSFTGRPREREGFGLRG